MKVMKFTARNIETGEVLTGNAVELSEKIGVSKTAIYTLERKGQKALHKWEIAKEGQQVVISPPKKRETKKCVICGKSFETNVSNQVVCGFECRKVYRRNATHKWLDKQRKSIKAEVKEMPKPKLSVTEIAIEARKAGMTYGQYVAKMGL